MSRKLVVMLTVCFFSVQASEQVSDKSIERVCQDLVLRLALPKIGDEQASESNSAKLLFSVRVVKKAYDRDTDLAIIELWYENKVQTTLLTKESRDRKERRYTSTWQHANLKKSRPVGQARENFNVLNALYDQLPVEQQKYANHYFKDATMLLPIVDEHKNGADQAIFDADDKPAIQNPRKRRLNFGA